MSDVTRILSQIEEGDPSAAEQLLPLVYDELRRLAAAKMAQEKSGQTLQATALATMAAPNDNYIPDKWYIVQSGGSYKLPFRLFCVSGILAPEAVSCRHLHGHWPIREMASHRKMAAAASFKLGKSVVTCRSR